MSQSQAPLNILITNAFIGSYSGSEIAVLDIALTLQAMGHKVSVFTWRAYDPLRAKFAAAGVPVITDAAALAALGSVDLLWGQHAPVLTQALQYVASVRHVISVCLSPFAPLETPPDYTGHLSLCLFNSAECLERWKPLLPAAAKTDVFVNSVTEFFRYLPRKTERLKQIAVVSNHVPDELRAMADLLRAEGVIVDLIGDGNDNYAFIDAPLLESYDAVISIGRSVQYALALGMPVFCYDVHGGPGWITPANVDRALHYNFSGRCTGNKRAAAALTDEVRNGYATAFAARQKLADLAARLFNLRQNLTKVLSAVAALPPVDVAAMAAVSLDWHSHAVMAESAAQLVTRDTILNMMYNGYENPDIDVKRLSAAENGWYRQMQVMRAQVVEMKTLRRRHAVLEDKYGLVRVNMDMEKNRANELQKKFSESDYYLARVTDNLNSVLRKLEDREFKINQLESQLARSGPAASLPDEAYIGADEMTALNSTFAKRYDGAIVLHLYYEELTEHLFSAYLDPLAEMIDLFVTLPPRVLRSTVESIRQRFPNTYFIPVENRGRDIRPFLQALPVLQGMGYQLVCKLHGKRSTHLANGDLWRDKLFDAIVKTPEVFVTNVMAMAANPKLGMIAPTFTFERVREARLATNREWLDVLLKRLGREDQIGVYDWHYAAGSMMIARITPLMKLAEVIDLDEFEAETGQMDGTLAHAVERMFAFINWMQDYQVGVIGGAEKKAAANAMMM